MIFLYGFKLFKLEHFWARTMIKFETVCYLYGFELRFIRFLYNVVAPLSMYKRFWIVFDVSKWHRSVNESKKFETKTFYQGWRFVWKIVVAVNLAANICRAQTGQNILVLNFLWINFFRKIEILSMKFKTIMIRHGFK